MACNWLGWAAMALVAAVDAQNSSYTIGAWIPGSPATMLSTMRPLLEGFLNEEVGQKLSPPVQFNLVPVDYTADSSSHTLISEGKLDFLYTLAGGISCAVIENGWAVIATRRVRIGDKESGADGSIVYSLKSNTHIQNISDLMSKRIGMGFILSATSYQSGFQLLAESSVHVLKDLDQFVFYGNDFERQFQDVMAGKIDAGFVSSTWIAENHPDKLDQLIIHRQLHPSYENEEFAFPTSTPLLPQYGLTVSPRISWQIKRAVAKALQDLSGSHPAAVTAHVAGFTGPGSYMGVRATQRTMKILTMDSRGVSRCANQWSAVEIWNSFDCSSIPGDFIKISLEESLAKCGQSGISCPDGLICFCRPCVVNPETNYFNWKLVMALCITVYVVGVFFALFLRPGMDGADLASRHPATKGRGGGGRVQHRD